MALNALLLTNVLSAPLPCLGETSDGNANEDLNLAEPAERQLHDQHTDLNNNTDFNEACNLYENLMAGTLSVEEVCKSDVLKRIKDHLQKHTESTKKSSRKSALWVQYMDMFDIVRKYIRAERTGNWELHLQAL